MALGLRYVSLDEESFATALSLFEIGCSAVALDGGKDLDAKAMSMVATQRIKILRRKFNGNIEWKLEECFVYPLRCLLQFIHKS